MTSKRSAKLSRSLALAIGFGALAAPAWAGQSGPRVELSDVICVPSSAATERGEIPWRTPGTPMHVEITLENHGCGQVHYGGVRAGLAGNAGGTLANVGLFGPFSRNVSGTLPPGTDCEGWCEAPPVNEFEFCTQDSDCDDQGGDGVCRLIYARTPSQTPVQVKVVDGMPASLQGTVAEAAVWLKVRNEDGEDRIDAFCSVEVRP